MMKSDSLLISSYLFSDTPLVLHSKRCLRNVQVAYTINGNMKPGIPIIYIAHSLTGDQYVASDNPITKRKGWWTEYVGKGKVIDTDKYCIICSNVLGGCMGTTGPATMISPDEERYWGGDFPVITIQDMIKVQREFLRSLGIDKLHAIIGGSMGGMQALEWLRLYPEITNRYIVIASSYRQPVQNIGFHEIGRNAIQLDPNWLSGHYLSENKKPSKGLKIARMVAHMTYLSSNGITKKFGRRLQDKNDKSYNIDEIDFQLESYLNYQGWTFTDRFDPCSYIYITKAVDYFDQSEDFFGDLNEAYSHIPKLDKKSVDMIGYDSDWLYPISEMETIRDAINLNGGKSSLTEFSSIYGHDSFLLHDVRLQKKIYGRLNE